MKIYRLGEQLQETSLEQTLAESTSALFLVSSKECTPLLVKIGIFYDGDIHLAALSFLEAEEKRGYLLSKCGVRQRLSEGGNGEL